MYQESSGPLRKSDCRAHSLLPRHPPPPLRFWFALPRTTRCIHQQSFETVAERGHIVAAGFLVAAVAAGVRLPKVIQIDACRILPEVPEEEEEEEEDTMKNIVVVRCMPVQTKRFVVAAEVEVVEEGTHIVVLEHMKNNTPAMSIVAGNIVAADAEGNIVAARYIRYMVAAADAEKAEKPADAEKPAAGFQLQDCTAGAGVVVLVHSLPSS